MAKNRNSANDFANIATSNIYVQYMLNRSIHEEYTMGSINDISKNFF